MVYGAGIIGSANGGIADAKRERHMPSQVNRLKYAVETLQKHVAVLHGRLDHVARPSGKRPGEIEKDAPREVLVQMAAEIENEIEKIEAMSAGLDDLLERLEL